MKITPTEAIARIQQIVGLQETGKWDDATISHVLQALQGSTFFDNKQLTRIEKKLDHMATDQKTFDEALKAFIADLTQKLSDGQKALQVAVQAIIDKIAQVAPGVDLTAETQQLADAQKTFDDTIAALPASLPTTPTPTP